MLHWQEKPNVMVVRTHRSQCCKCLRAETGHDANMPISWLMVRDVVIWYYWADLRMCLSSRALVMRGRWDLACRSVWQSSKLLIRHSHGSGWMSNTWISDITKRKSTLLIGNDLASIEFLHLLVCFSFINWGITRYSEQTQTIQSSFKWEIHYTTFLLDNTSGSISASCLV